MRKSFLLFGLSLCLFFAAQAQDAPKDTTLQEFVGKYVFPSGSIIADVTVSIENGALSISSSAGPSALVKKEADLYTITAFNGTAKFNRDSNKKIIGVSVDARGYQLEGTKTAENRFTYIFPKTL